MARKIFCVAKIEKDLDMAFTKVTLFRSGIENIEIVVLELDEQEAANFPLGAKSVLALESFDIEPME